MPFDPSGNFSRMHSWQQDRDNGIRILADRHDEEDDNFGNAFNLTFLRTGTVPMTGNLVMGGNAIKLIKAGSEAAPGLSFELSNQTGIWQPNPTTVAVSSNGVKKFEVNGSGVGIFGDTAFNGNTTISGTLGVTGDANVTGNLGVTGGITATGNVYVGPSLALHDDVANDKDFYIYFNNHENTVNYATIGVNASGALALSGTNIIASGNLSIIGSVSSSGSISASTLWVTGGPTNFYLSHVSSANPIINFDSNDYLTYDIGANQLDMLIGGVSHFSLNAGGVAVNGTISATGNIGTNTSVTIADGQYYLNMQPGGPYFVVDTGDYMRYNRSPNQFEWVIGESSRLLLDAASLNLNGNFHVNGGTVYSIDGSYTGDVTAYNITGTNAVYAGNTGQFLMVDQGATKTISFVSGATIVYDSSSLRFVHYVNGAVGLIVHPGVIESSSLRINNGVDNTYYLNGDAGYANWNVDTGDWYRFNRAANAFEFVIGNAVAASVGTVNAVFNGSVLVAAYYYGGKVHAVAAGDGHCMDARDMAGNPKSQQITFTNNDSSAQYGHLGYGGNTMYLYNGLGDLVLTSVGWIISGNNHQFNADMFQPNCPTSAAGANAVYASGNSNQRLRSTSALRYKTNVRDISDEVHIIDRVRPVAYTSLCEADDPERVFYGMIAEEVEELDCNFVEYDGEGRPDGLNYQAFTPLLIKEVQALRARVDFLEKANRGRH